MENLTRRRLALFLGELNDDLDFPCEVSTAEQTRAIEVLYRGVRLQRIDDRDDRDASWWPRNVYAVDAVGSLPTALFPEDSLPVYTLLDAVQCIKDIDLLVDWLPVKTQWYDEHCGIVIDGDAVVPSEHSTHRMRQVR